jgi:hypothetical protein
MPCINVRPRPTTQVPTVFVKPFKSNESESGGGLFPRWVLRLFPTRNPKINGGEKEGRTMKTLTQFKKTPILPLLIVLAFVVGAALTATSSITEADHVRWDIISLDTSTTPPTIRPGGVAFASAISGSAPSGLKIEFTGSGTFVAPASGGGSGGSHRRGNLGDI